MDDEKHPLQSTLMLNAVLPPTSALTHAPLVPLTVKEALSELQHGAMIEMQHKRHVVRELRELRLEAKFMMLSDVQNFSAETGPKGQSGPNLSDS